MVPQRVPKSLVGGAAKAKRTKALLRLNYKIKNPFKHHDLGGLVYKPECNLVFHRKFLFILINFRFR